ncbi:MAG: FkbM family methyltransferase [Bacteroidales bacterium]|nr:FkbM family methyltransferase [Bacteroidales bacterium]
MKLFIQITAKNLFKFLTNSNYRKYLRLALFYGDRPRYHQYRIKFSKVKFDVPDCRSFIPQYKDIFVDEDYKFEANSDKPLIYDCGANIGMSVFYFSKLYRGATIKAFEANPLISSILETNIARNNIGNVEVINKAVWIDDNGVDFSMDMADASSIFTNGNKEKIESVRLRDLIAREDKIDLLKMDIEGAETEVIKDCIPVLNKIDKLFIEYHTFNNQPQKLSVILSILEKNGFRYFLENVNDRKCPFINTKSDNNASMDTQFNIYAYRI